MHATHLSAAVNLSVRLETLASAGAIISRLKEHGLKFDAFAVRGTSGMVAAGHFGAHFEVNTCIIRKPNEVRNSSFMMETPEKVSNYIVLDDLCDSGETLYSIVKAMKVAHPRAKCMGALLYVDDCFMNPQEVVDRMQDFVEEYPDKVKRYKDILKFEARAIKRRKLI